MPVPPANPPMNESSEITNGDFSLFIPQTLGQIAQRCRAIPGIVLKHSAQVSEWRARPVFQPNSANAFSYPDRPKGLTTGRKLPTGTGFHCDSLRERKRPRANQQFLEGECYLQYLQAGKSVNKSK